jgi:hypothetical protein
LHSDECNSIKAEDMHAKRLRLACIRVSIPLVLLSREKKKALSKKKEKKSR